MGHTLSPERGERSGPDQGPNRPNLQGTAATATRDSTAAPAQVEADLATGKTADRTWRAVPGWEGFYEVRAFPPAVRSLDRVVEDRKGRSRRLRGRDLVVTTGGVSLSQGGRRRRHTLHTLVRAAFDGGAL